MVIAVGIDCGLGGAIAAINGDAEVLLLEDVPVLQTQTAKGKNKRRRYDAGAFGLLLGRVRDEGLTGDRIVVAIEELTPRPGPTGASGNFRNGYGFGLWEGTVAALGYPYELVTPQRWRSEIGLPKGSDKNESRRRALQLFPSERDRLRRVSDDGRAEALLIAEYVRRCHAESPERG